MRVVVADDAVILREGLARLLLEAGFEVAGLAADGDELLEQVERFSPDVAIVDIRMPPTHTDEGLQAAKAIRQRRPEASRRTSLAIFHQQSCTGLQGTVGKYQFIMRRKRCELVRM